MRSKNQNQSKRPALFIDRDGTLVEEVNYLSTVEKTRLVNGAAEALGRLKELGYLLIVVTNQSGIGRGIFDEAAMHAVHDHIQSELDGAIDAFYFCPHLPCDACLCRKPSTGMIRSACDEFEIDLGRSWMVGDKNSDIEAGRNAGLRSALVLTGYGAVHSQDLKHAPDIIASDFAEAVRQMLDLERS